MDNEMRKEAIHSELKEKFKGKSEITAKYIPKFPYNAEREYNRILKEYLSIEKQVLLKHMPEIKRIVAQGSVIRLDGKKENENKRKAARFSTVDNTFVKLRMVFDTIHKEMGSMLGLYDIKRKMNDLSKLTQKLTISEWKKTIHKTLGIDLLEDYYKGDMYEKLIKEWISDNVSRIKELPETSLEGIRKQVYEDFMGGKPTTTIMKSIQEQYQMTKQRAALISRDQIGKLNSQITKSQQADAGIKKYEWSACRDSRVRDCHRDLDGSIFSWNDPPEMYRVTMKKGRIYLGRKCHPGEDYQCRCCAIPVIDLDNVDLPF